MLPIVWSELSRKLIPCDCLVRSKGYTFLESLLIGEQNKHGAHNRKNLNISWTTNVITMKLYTIIVLRITNILQEISRPDNLRTRMKITFLVCNIVRNCFLWLKLCTLKGYHKVQLWSKFEVNRIEGSNVIGWSVNYTWNLSKGST